MHFAQHFTVIGIPSFVPPLLFPWSVAAPPWSRVFTDHYKRTTTMMKDRESGVSLCDPVNT